ncbi:MAG: hypothetical protein HRU33_12220 [Rhodobacteraceae bacterium]|nr:hypothetical protein [Paracoccaceae bacterium]
MSRTAHTAFISPTAQIWSDDTGEEPGDRPLSPLIAVPMNRSQGAAK